MSTWLYVICPGCDRRLRVLQVQGDYYSGDHIRAEEVHRLGSIAEKLRCFNCGNASFDDSPVLSERGEHPADRAALPPALGSVLGSGMRSAHGDDDGG